MTNVQAIFSDITHHWARPFIQRLQNLNFVNGFPDGTFRPEQTITRAEFASLIRSAFPCPLKRQYIPFEDVLPNFWATQSIQKAFEAGFISGFPDGTFRPQDPVTRLQLFLALASGLNLVTSDSVSALEVYVDRDRIPDYAKKAIHAATQTQIIVNFPKAEALNPNLPATRAEVAASIYQALVFLQKVPPLVSRYIVEPAKQGLIQSGTHLSVNGRKWRIPWSQWSSGFARTTGISDKGAMQVLGFNVLNSNDPKIQTATWFSSSTVYTFPTAFDSAYRYLKFDEFAELMGWELRIEDQTLVVTSPVQTVKTITFKEQTDSSDVILELNQKTPWELYQQSTQWEVVVDAVTPSSVAAPFQGQKPNPSTPGTNSEEKNEGETGSSSQKPTAPIVKISETQTVISGNLPDGYGVKVSTLSNPPRIVVELRKDALVNRDIIWQKGLRWKQSYLTLNSARFPVVWLTMSPASGLALRPIWTDKTQMKGINGLTQITETWQCLAGINGGYFNRNNLLPLGAIRRDGKWMSGPILNRGAMAWNDTGTVKMARLGLKEILTTSTGQRLESELLNTGYVKAGIARYTPEWGDSYTPLTLNEVVVFVENQQVVRHQEQTDDKTPIAIPKNGYLLTLRSFRSALSALAVGTKITLESQTTPADFNQFPQILGGGPLLVQNGQVVVDAIAEGFNVWFADQAAIRSAVGVTAKGELLIATVHNRVGGTGPKLTELAQLMQQLGAVDALNLDGGSSTSLVLGGQLLNRTPDTAARVHNGLGVFRV